MTVYHPARMVYTVKDGGIELLGFLRGGVVPRNRTLWEVPCFPPETVMTMQPSNEAIHGQTVEVVRFSLSILSFSDSYAFTKMVRRGKMYCWAIEPCMTETFHKLKESTPLLGVHQQ